MARDRPSRYGEKGNPSTARDRPSRYGGRRGVLGAVARGLSPALLIV